MESIVGLGLGRFRQNPLEFDLERHRVGAALMGHEEFTVAVKHAIFKSHMVIIVIAMEGHIKLVEGKTILLFGIAFRFFPFSDHSIVHF